MANLMGHRPWASCADVVENYDPTPALMLKCQAPVFTEELRNSKIQTYTEKYPYAVIERGLVHYFATKDEAKLYVHEHAIDLAREIKRKKEKENAALENRI